MYKFRATVANDIWPETLFFTCISIMVTLVTKLAHHNLAIGSSLLTVLGTVLGLVISFRTSSAYERFQDGRKLWTSIATCSRTLGQLLWVHVGVDRVKPNDPIANEPDKVRAERIKAVIEKRSMINLVQAFGVSVKHYLRDENGIYYEDLYPLISFLPRYHTEIDPTHHDSLPMWLGHEKLYQSARSSPAPSIIHKTPRKYNIRNDSYDPEKALPRIASEVPLRGARNPPEHTIYDMVPFLIILKPFIAVPKWIYQRLTRVKEKVEDEELGMSGRKKRVPVVDSNIPLEITLFLHSYVAFLLKNALLQPAVASSLIATLGTMQDTVNNLERVRSTPIPFAYQAHLRMSLWLYLLFLPFQVISTMSWMTIPGTCFASFLLLGFLEIGQEIENPFNYDENDLDMDSFCLAMTRELHEITAHPVPDPTSYIFSASNQPFAPADCRTAEEIVSDVNHEYHGPERGMDSIRRTLLRSWKEVEVLTREK